MSELWKLDERVSFSLRELYQKYGYSRFKMSKFEPYDLYMQNKEFLVSDGIITFTNTDGTLMALKPDVTLSIVKNFRKDQTPIQKVCYDENVYRITGSGHDYKEIMQAGLECMGDVGHYEIYEVLMLAVRSLQNISDKFVLEISNMDIVSDILNSMHLTEDQTSEVIHHLSEKNEDALHQVLSSEQIQKILPIMKISGPMIPALKGLEKFTTSPALKRLQDLADCMIANNLPCDQVHIDFSIISDRHYYNGIVFRGYVEGIPTNVLSGGQYDKLMHKMRKQANAIGFAVYLDQLELLDRSVKDYDVDTVLLYGSEDNPIEISKAVETLAPNRVLASKEIPSRIRYRNLMKISNGRLVNFENNG